MLELDQVAEGSMAPYTSLIYDVLRGDRSLFTSSAGLAAAFTRLPPLLDSPPALETYDDDSWGPAAADRLTDGLGWQLERGDAEGELSRARNSRAARGERRTSTAGPMGSAAQDRIRSRLFGERRAVPADDRFAWTQRPPERLVVAVADGRPVDQRG